MRGGNSKKPDLEKTIPDLPGNRRGFKGRSTFEERMQQRQENLDYRLIHAVVTAPLAKVKELVRDGADVNAKDDRGRSALKWAEFTGRKDIAEFLRSRGAKE